MAGGAAAGNAGKFDVSFPLGLLCDSLLLLRGILGLDWNYSHLINNGTTMGTVRRTLEGLSTPHGVSRCKMSIMLVHQKANNVSDIIYVVYYMFCIMYII